MSNEKQAPESGHLRYVDKLGFQSDPDSSREVRLISHTELLVICDIFLSLTHCRFKDRWPASKERRRELGAQFTGLLPAKWPEYGEWESGVRNALCEIQRKGSPLLPPGEFCDGEPWHFVENDIHNAARCARATISLFSENDAKHIPMKTDTFIVPSAWSDAVGSLISGVIRPVWVACVDSGDTPGVALGLYPKYAPLQP